MEKKKIRLKSLPLFYGWKQPAVYIFYSDCSVTDKRTYVRLEAVLAVTLKESIAALSGRLGKSGRSIYRWCVHYLKSHDPQRSGRPKAAQAITEKRILQVLGQSPLKLGYRAGGWTVGLLARYLSARYHCAIAPHTLRRQMKGMGLRYKRPRMCTKKRTLTAFKKGRSFVS